jgi:hypothetical protein
LRVITESWLMTYRKALESAGFTQQTLLRINPTPRLAVLVDQGMLPPDHEEARRLLAAFQQAMARASG